MSDRPVFIYAATYASYDDCLADYELLLEAHAAKLVGTYDVALIRKDNEGKIHVEKHEKPTQHGAWGGIAVGALVGVLFAPLVLGAAAVGGLAGGIGGHLKKGTSRDDATELGELLEDGQSALVVIGESRVGEQLDKALTRAEQSIEKEIDADAKALERELTESERIYRPGETVPVSGIYNVVDLNGAYQGRQVTGEAGRTFEPTRHGTAEYGFVLYRQTAHLGT